MGWKNQDGAHLKSKTAYMFRFAAFFAVSTLLFSLLFILHAQYFDTSKVVSAEQLRCLTYLKEGKLYGNQPFCTQGPLFYVLLRLFELLSPLHFEAISAIALFLLHAAIVTFLSWAVQKETGKPRWLFVLLGYTTIIYYPWHRSLTITLATGLLLAGFYALYYRNKPVVGGALLMLATLTKATAGTAALIAAGWFAYRNVLEINVHSFRLKVTLRKERWKPVLLLIGAMAAVSLLLLFIFPGMMLHTFYGATRSTTPHSLIQTMSIFFYRNIVSLNPFNMTTYLVLFLAAIAFWMHRTVFGAIAAFGGFATALVLSRNIPLISTSAFLVPYFVFGLITFFVASRHVSTRKGMIVTILIALSMFAGTTAIALDIGKYYVRQLVEKPLEFIPHQQDPVLINAWSDEQARYRIGSFLAKPLPRIIAAKPPPHVDDTQRPAWISFGLVTNMSAWDEVLAAEYSTQINSTLAQLEMGNYSLIFLAQPYGKEVATDLGPRMSEIFNTNQMYCMQVVPYLHSFRNIVSGRAALLFLRSMDDCILFHAQLESYYTEHFQSICTWTPSYAAYIRDTILPLDTIQLKMECNETGMIDFVVLYDAVTSLMVTDPVPAIVQYLPYSQQ